MDDIIVTEQAQADMARRGVPPAAIRFAFANPLATTQEGDEFKVCGAVGDLRLWIVYRRDGDKVLITRVRAERIK